MSRTNRKEVEAEVEGIDTDNGVSVIPFDSILDQGWISDAEAKENAGSTPVSKDQYAELFDKVLERHHKAVINACYRIVFGSKIAAMRSSQVAYHVRRREEYKDMIELARMNNVIVILPAGRKLT